MLIGLRFNMKNCIVYLLRSSIEDVEMLNKSLNLLEMNLLRFTSNYDVIIFHENTLGDLKQLINSNLNIKYQEISIEQPNYSEEVQLKIPKFFPHPTHGEGPIAWGHPGFSIGYRNMCRFFSGEFHNLPILKNYKYYLRLDSDSYILSPLNYDIFKYADFVDLVYGYCEPAVQIDNPKVVEGLNRFTKEYLQARNINTYHDIDLIPEGKMFYTNFELGKVDWFINSEYIRYYNEIDRSGNIYIRRWGDAPIKYLGVTLFCEPEKVVPIRGFTYQHGAIYSL